MMADLSALLDSNSYPGRGILLGLSPDGTTALCAYFIMGRSANSRNRIFVQTQDGIRTQAYDAAAMTDPSLIIYHPVRSSRYGLIVTNGNQTDTIQQAFASGKSFAQARPRGSRAWRSGRRCGPGSSSPMRLTIRPAFPVSFAQTAATCSPSLRRRTEIRTAAAGSFSNIPNLCPA